MSERLTGTVKFYNTEKAFGFITGDDNKDHFMHISGIAKDADGQALFVPQEGERVSFEVVPGNKGPMAANVEQEGSAAGGRTMSLGNDDDMSMAA